LNKSQVFLNIYKNYYLKKLWYYFFKTIIKISLFFYSKKIKVLGLENVPKKGAVLFAVNHPNGLLDPLMVTTSCQRENHYLVMAAAFKKPLIKKFLMSLNLLPIYRIRDGASLIGENTAIFEQCFDLFKNQKSLMIFPEGGHNRKRTIRPISKGFTRIVFGALEKYPDLKITIIPVGLTYQNTSSYPAKVVVNYGQPIAVNDFYNKEKLVLTTNNLKKEVSNQLRKLSVHIKDDENYNRNLTKLNEAQVDFTAIDKVNRMIESDSYPKHKKAKKNYFKWLFYLILLNSVFPYLIWKKNSKTLNEIEFIDTFRFGINTVFIPVFYGLQAFIISLFFDWKIGGYYLLASLILILIHSKFSATNTEAVR
jgi:1-acyl-sn-glycerol-3-phosphate acyltransferase